MGSDSDLPVMQGAADALTEFGVDHEVRVISAHRTPDAMVEYARTAADRGLRVIVAGAGGAAHLPGMTASMTPLGLAASPMTSIETPLRIVPGVPAISTYSLGKLPVTTRPLRRISLKDATGAAPAARHEVRAWSTQG